MWFNFVELKSTMTNEFQRKINSQADFSTLSQTD